MCNPILDVHHMGVITVRLLRGALVAVCAAILITPAAQADLRVDVAKQLVYQSYEIGGPAADAPGFRLLCDICDSIAGALKFLRMTPHNFSVEEAMWLNGASLYLMMTNGGTVNLFQWRF